MGARISNHFLPFLEDVPKLPQIERIIQGALGAVDPEKLICSRVVFKNNSFIIHSQNSPLFKMEINPRAAIRIISIGKAATVMATSISGVLEGRKHKGLIVDKYSTLPIPPDFERVIAGHPIPDENSLYAGKRCAEFLSDCKEDDLTICLISGGGSALLCYPAEGIDLDDLKIVNQNLLACGATITEINSVRRPLDRVKGGGLAHLAKPSNCLSLILSDVIGDPISVIASGPTCADELLSPMEVIDRYELREKIPDNVIKILDFAMVEKQLRPKNVLANLVIGNNQTALLAAKREAIKAGWMVFFDNSPYSGLTSDVSKEIYQKIMELNEKRSRPWLYLRGGEPTVRIRGKGKGGRNQQLALELTARIRVFSEWCLICLATDGDDGPTDAAGAIISPDIYKKIGQLGLNIEEAAHNNDAYTFLVQTGNLIKTGPTGTNVNDILLFFGF